MHELEYYFKTKKNIINNYELFKKRITPASHCNVSNNNFFFQKDKKVICPDCKKVFNGVSKEYLPKSIDLSLFNNGYLDLDTSIQTLLNWSKSYIDKNELIPFINNVFERFYRLYRIEQYDYPNWENRKSISDDIDYDELYREAYNNDPSAEWGNEV